MDCARRRCSIPSTACSRSNTGESRTSTATTDIRSFRRATLSRWSWTPTAETGCRRTSERTTDCRSRSTSQCSSGPVNVNDRSQRQVASRLRRQLRTAWDRSTCKRHVSRRREIEVTTVTVTWIALTVTRSAATLTWCAVGVLGVTAARSLAATVTRSEVTMTAARRSARSTLTAAWSSATMTPARRVAVTMAPTLRQRAVAPARQLCTSSGKGSSPMPTNALKLNCGRRRR